jgi:serine/threonine protein kinase
VIHGDIRPGNILFDADENAYMSDFGRHRLRDSRGRWVIRARGPISRAGAPDRRTPSVAADIFALAIVLGELLRDLVDGPDRSELASVLERATSLVPTDRPSAVAELIGGVTHAVLAPSASDGVARSMGGPLRNPYKGLRPFLEADAADFVGRESLVDQLRRADGGSGAEIAAVGGRRALGQREVVGRQRRARARPPEGRRHRL